MAKGKPAIGRRRVLVGLAGTVGGLILVGCGANREDPVPVAAQSKGMSLGARFADGFLTPTVLVAGTVQRAPYVLEDSDGWPIVKEAPGHIDLVVRKADTSEVVFSERINRHGEPGMTPYYPLIFTPPMVGSYNVDGPGLVGSHRFRVADPGTTDLVQVGDLMRPVDTPTTDDSRGVKPICTWPGRTCPLHAVTLTEALDRPGPTALLVSTPQFCQADVCGPALGILVDQATQLSEEWSVVHAEVFTDPMAGDFTLAPVVAVYGLSFEPSLVVADRSGVVTGVVHFTMDDTEVAEALESAA